MGTALFADPSKNSSARVTSPHCTSTLECVRHEVNGSELTVEMDQGDGYASIVLDMS